jgi:predicted Rossmann-fold nucleotide-binding protein
MKPSCDEIHTPTEFDELADRRMGAGPARAPETDDEIVVQGLDLQDRTDQILASHWQGITFLGCTMEPSAQQHVVTQGATWFPAFDDLPYNPYRANLYTGAELNADDLDGRIYRHQAQYRHSAPKPILEALAQRIHDHAIDNALGAYLADHRKIVAIMGGHSLHRDDDIYPRVAQVARALTRAGHLVVTGGGPGAMEAGNLGAWLAPLPDDALTEAVAMLSTAVDYSTTEYLTAASEVLERFPGGAESLAIPTWFYGHEPTNAFATAVAKYFSNSIREDGLLAIATNGVVYTPGAAGTVQEVFMDATQNHYVTFDVVSPMVFMDSAYWADDRLAAPKLLRQLAGERPYADMIAVLDDPSDIVEFIETHPPHPV